ncbi:MAG: hypothetical protein AB1295_00670 [Candidatus Micrarchaeota archaeon]
MNRFKLTSFLFIMLGALVMFGAAYVVISYAQGVIGAIVDFVTTNDFTKLQQCGVNPPGEFNKLKSEFATLILPALYLGIPVLLLVISALMFLAGFYYHKGKLQDDSMKAEQLEREMVHKVVQKMEREKRPAARRVLQGPEDEPEEAPREEEEAPEEGPAQEPADEGPEEKPSRFKLFGKKKK